MLFFLPFYFLEMHSSTTHISPQVKAWIEIEKKVQFLFVSAKLQNFCSKVLTLDYILEARKEGGCNHCQTVQKGKCISQNQNIILLSKSGINLHQKENLIVSLKIFYDGRIIARDLVVFQVDNP